MKVKFNKLVNSYLLWYILLFLIPYCIIPFIYCYDKYTSNVEILGFCTILSCIFFAFGLNLGRAKNHLRRRYLILDFDKTAIYIFSCYLIIVILIFLTAGHIPILESIKGASQEALMGDRSSFLKERIGWESSLVYLITIIDSAILPYIIIESLIRRHKYRYIFILIFFCYSISFLEKAYFLKLLLPIFIYKFYTVKNKKRFLLISLGAVFGLFFVMFALSGFGSSGLGFLSYKQPFFSMYYIPSGVMDAIFWRSIAVPIVTALDGIKLFLGFFQGTLFLGSTSSLIAFLVGENRVNFERILYQTQYGGGGFGNANQFFLVEAFVNFGYLGVILFSFIVGKLIKGCLKTENIAIISIMPLFLYNLFNSGLIGNLFSNGFLLFFIFVRKCKFTGTN